MAGIAFIDLGVVVQAIGVLVALVLGVGGIWREWIVQRSIGPRLKVSVDTNPPDADRTTMSVLSGGQLQGSVPCYYFRVRVKNEGKQTARGVEVFVKEVKRRQTDNTRCVIPDFPPMSLLWSHVRAVAQDLHPGIEKFCDLGYVINPDAIRQSRTPFVLEAKKAQRVTKPSHPCVFTFDLQAKPNHQGHIVGFGEYRIVLAVGAANLSAQEWSLRMSFDGKWYENESRMFSEGLRLLDLRRV